MSKQWPTSRYFCWHPFVASPGDDSHWYPSWEVSTRIPMFCWGFPLSPQYPISYQVVTPHGSWIVRLIYRIYIYICIYSYCWSPSPCLFLGWFIPIVQKIIKIQVINYCWFLPRDVSYIRASSLLWLLLDFHVFLKQWNPIVLSPQVCLPFPSY